MVTYLFIYYFPLHPGGETQYRTLCMTSHEKFIFYVLRNAYIKASVWHSRKKSKPDLNCFNPCDATIIHGQESKRAKPILLYVYEDGLLSPVSQSYTSQS